MTQVVSVRKEAIMQIRIIGLGGKVPDSLREFVRRRVAFALGRFETRISRVTIRLGDLNGPKGGLDKQCSMQAKLATSGLVIAEVVDSQVESAVARAADRLSRGLRTELERRRDR